MKPEQPSTFTTKLSVNDALKMELKTAAICLDMENNGFPLDEVECKNQIDQLQERVDWVDEAIHPFIPAKPALKGSVVTKIWKLNGEYTKQILDWMDGEDIDVEAEFCRIEYVPFNLDSSKQVSDWLLAKGWEPDEWNYKKVSGKDVRDSQGNKIKTSPKITEESLDSLEELGIAGRLIAYRRKCTHRRNQLRGFLSRIREDGCVPSKVNTLGAATRRMTHQNIVNVPNPGKKGAFWKQMRKVFWSGDSDWVVVGADASQIQIRGLAHYAAVVANNYQLIDDLVAGDEGRAPDIHTLNGQRSGTTRQESKGIFYGYLFGAGIPKTASQLKLSIAKTKAIRAKFDAAVPFVQTIVDHLTKFYRIHGYITGLDGTRIYAESEHMLLVYLLQNFEAVFMKCALCYAIDRIKKRGIRAKLCTMQHDEFQFICHKDDAKRLARLLETVMKDAGKFVGSLCPVIGEAKIGNTWYDTH